MFRVKVGGATYPNKKKLVGWWLLLYIYTYTYVAVSRKKKRKKKAGNSASRYIIRWNIIIMVDYINDQINSQYTHTQTMVCKMAIWYSSYQTWSNF